MKLANALSERATLQEKIVDLRGRIENNAAAQEGDTPGEDPLELLQILEETLDRYTKILTAINLTNSRTLTAEGTTVTELLSRREAIEKRIDVLSRLAQSAGQCMHRYGRNEIRWYPTVSIPKIRKAKDDAEKQLRLLNDRLQEINWTTDLLEEDQPGG